MIAFQNRINIGGRIKRVAQGLEGGNSFLSNTVIYTCFI